MDDYAHQNLLYCLGLHYMHLICLLCSLDERNEHPEPQSQLEDIMQVESAPQAGPSTVGSGDPGQHGSAAPMQPDVDEQCQKQGANPQHNLNTNPYRSLGQALEHWRANLSVTQEADEQKQVCGEMSLEQSWYAGLIVKLDVRMQLGRVKDRKRERKEDKGRKENTMFGKRGQKGIVPMYLEL